MANLTENPASWESGVYQLETTDPVLGGVPNVGTGAGMSNIPHLQLANRTAFLKKVIDDTGLGAAAVPLVTLNSAAARITGSYRFASADANTPASGVAGTVEVIAASASAVNQTARDSANAQMWTRFWNGTVWSAWAEILFGQDLTGMIAHFARNTAPSGFLKANGAAVSRTVYARLFAAIGTTFGTGDGTTTFTLPDLRAEFIRGWDDGRGVDTGRAFGSAQGHQFEDHQHDTRGSIQAASGSFATALNAGGTVTNTGTLAISGSRGAETRPRNIALLTCIKF
jgi:phage-related tail fiber protein